jgi:hypothetical protein
MGRGRLWGFGPGLAGPAGRVPFSFSKTVVYCSITESPHKSHRLNDFQAHFLHTSILYCSITESHVSRSPPTAVLDFLCTYPSKSGPSSHVFRLHLTHLTIRSTTCPALKSPGNKCTLFHFRKCPQPSTTCATSAQTLPLA